MKYWYSLSLGDGIVAGLPTSEIESAFLRSFSAAGNPPEMAVFTRPESDGRLHCEVMAYFSPAAEQVASAFGADPCARPERAGLTLLAGDERAWPLLFPESER